MDSKDTFIRRFLSKALPLMDLNQSDVVKRLALMPNKERMIVSLRDLLQNEAPNQIRLRSDLLTLDKINSTDIFQELCLRRSESSLWTALSSIGVCLSPDKVLDGVLPSNDNSSPDPLLFMKESPLQAQQWLDGSRPLPQTLEMTQEPDFSPGFSQGLLLCKCKVSGQAPHSIIQLPSSIVKPCALIYLKLDCLPEVMSNVMEKRGFFIDPGSALLSHMSGLFTNTGM